MGVLDAEGGVKLGESDVQIACAGWHGISQSSQLDQCRRICSAESASWRSSDERGRAWLA